MGDKIPAILHDADCHRDIKIVKLMQEFGLEGYAIFWISIELMLQSDDYAICEDDIDAHAYALRIESDRLTSVLQKAVDVQLFTFEGGSYFSTRLLERVRKFEEKRDQAREAGKKSAKKRKKTNTKNDSSTTVQRMLNETDKDIDKDYDKDNQSKKNGEPRIEYGDFVSFKPETHEKLKAELGPALFNTCIEVLHDWVSAKSPAPGEKPTKEFKDAKRKAYNAAHTFRTWVIAEGRKRMAQNSAIRGDLPKYNGRVAT